MAARKYAELLDIDPNAQDVFETPDLTDDTSTIPTSPPESSTDEIDRHGIDPDQARAVFLSPAERDITGKRKGYRSSSRWRRKDGLEVNGDELSSEEEVEEGVERKLARLRREIAEVKGEVERQNAKREEEKGKGDVSKDGKNAKKEVEDKNERITGEDVDALNEILNSVASNSGMEAHSAATTFTRRLALAPPSAPQEAPSTQKLQASSATSHSTTYTLSYAPTYNQTHTLSQITSFDTRLSALESLLGIDTLPLPAQLSSGPTPKPLLPTLNNLSTQITTLTTAISSPAALDTLTRRVRALASETQSLDAARRAAVSTRHPPRDDASDGTSTPTENSPADPVNYTDAITKLNALHALIPTITSLAPLLPPTLDRLRSLRTLHADAATASQTLQQVEERQEAVAEEVKSWRAALEGVEKKVAEAGERWEGNAKVVEGWVRELEGRMEALGKGG